MSSFTSFIRASIRLRCLASRLPLGIALLFPVHLVATEADIPATEQAESLDSMESSRNYWSGRITRFASDIDRFFGGDRHYQESNPTVIQLNITTGSGYDQDRALDIGARINLRLPVTEGKLRLLLQTGPENDIIAEPNPELNNVESPNRVFESNDVAVALRLVAEKEGIWNFNTDVGVKFPLPAQPFGRARGSYSAPLGMWRLKATQSVYWFSRQGAGETTQLDFERIYNDQLLFRATSNATWLEVEDNFDLKQHLSVYHTRNDRTAVLYQASVIGVSNPQVQVTDFVMLVSYRYRMHRTWLFLEVTPQLHFPRDRDFEFSPAFTIRVEMLLDDSR